MFKPAWAPCEAIVSNAFTHKLKALDETGLYNIILMGFAKPAMLPGTRS